jgi:hypothetical protein
MSRCVFSTDELFCGDSSLSCIYVGCVLLDRRYVIAFFPCSCSLSLGGVFFLVRGGCETNEHFNRNEHTFLYITALHTCTTKKTVGLFQHTNAGQCRDTSGRVQVNARQSKYLMMTQ